MASSTPSAESSRSSAEANASSESRNSSSSDTSTSASMASDDTLTDASSVYQTLTPSSESASASSQSMVEPPSIDVQTEEQPEAATADESSDSDIIMYEVDQLSNVPNAFDLPHRLRFLYRSGSRQSNEINQEAIVTRSTRRNGDSGSNTGSADTPSLLSLPDEVLDIIFRNLSNTPRSKNPLWESPIRAGNAMKLALTASRMFHIFRKNIISIRTRPERYREDLLYEPPVAGVVVDVRSPEDVEHFSTVLRIAGPALEELLITKSLHRHTWVNALESHVTGLKRLSVRDVNDAYPLEKILQVCSRTLRELEIVGATGMALSELQLQAIATHCSSVQSLALRLSMFDFDWTPVWMGIGPGLTRLSLGATRFWIMDTEETALLEQIGRYCCDITSLHFYHLGPTLGKACAKLCARYGNQLTSLELEQSQMLRPDLELLARTCKKTAVSISHGSSLFSHSYNMDVIDLLGGQISALRYRSQLAHDESLLEVGRICSTLRELRLDCASTLSESALDSILKGTAADLKKLSLSFFVRGLDRALVTTALRLLAKYARNLNDFHIGGQKFDMDAFYALIQQCKHSLRKISISFGFRTAGEREVVDLCTLVRVVEAVYPCEKLESLIIVDRTSSDNHANSRQLQQACYPLRKRLERVTICGYDYIR